MMSLQMKQMWFAVALWCAASMMLTNNLFAETNTPAEVKPFSGGSPEFKRLVWSDEFNTDGAPDAKSWDYEVGYVRNKERQYYTQARLENAVQRDGCLVITARREAFTDDKGKTHEVTSASLITRGKNSWCYGRIEARVRVPRALGTWPAVWMLPEKSVYGGWLNNGEIDILEHVGFDPDKVYFTVHTLKYNNAKGTGRSAQVSLANPDRDFHLYAIEWTAERIDWYLDDRKVFTIRNEREGFEEWPFDQPFYVILNLAFGGTWGAAKGVDLDALPQEFLIDYVRVFQ